MKRRELPEVLELFEQLASLIIKSIAFEGVVFRSASTLYANESDFVSGVGAAKSGGRWNPRRMRAVYGSTDVMTATAEAYRNFDDFGFSPATIRPRVMAALEVRMSSILDLTRASVLKVLEFSRDELVTEDWKALQDSGVESWTQAIGRGCRRVGFEGVLAPAARRRGGKNLVVFPDALHATSELTPVAAHELPPHPKDWSS